MFDHCGDKIHLHYIEFATIVIIISSAYLQEHIICKQQECYIQEFEPVQSQDILLLGLIWAMAMCVVLRSKCGYILMCAVIMRYLANMYSASL